MMDLRPHLCVAIQRRAATVAKLFWRACGACADQFETRRAQESWRRAVPGKRGVSTPVRPSVPATRLGGAAPECRPGPPIIFKSEWEQDMQQQQGTGTVQFLEPSRG